MTDLVFLRWKTHTSISRHFCMYYGFKAYIGCMYYWKQISSVH